MNFLKPFILAFGFVTVATSGYAASLDIVLDGGKRWEPVNAGTDGWGDGSGRFNFSGNSVIITIEDKASNPWQIQLKRPRVNLTKGQVYQIVAEVSASKQSPLTIMLQKDSGDYATYFAKDVAVNNTPKKIDISFTADHSDPKAAFAFFVGGAEPGVSYTFKNIRLTSVN
ncbi:carbohydrate binding domain-containing protein [Agarivorans sp. Alg241-V36]|uniref:carbohydrate binding domain-containing protein n=1 Tax=Agarivorans sp. Alg241-V36 TaxID=2305992 RepID=UPI0013D896F7|nr:carbohydrate binding domain-containing protein [Agarivorans sp. Alg241-V36]